jgi:pseudaminic acid biosynthesis-associated methylase
MTDISDPQMGELISPKHAWASEFGDAYNARNAVTDEKVRKRVWFWSEMLKHAHGINSVLEVGANTGINIHALRELLHSTTRFEATEPNAQARVELAKLNLCAMHDDIQSMKTFWKFDLVFTCGVLIHVPPDDLHSLCQKMYDNSQSQILCAEYFSDQPTEIEYRGKMGMLWKRDFGKYWIDNFNVDVIDYGFSWREAGGMDNITWWLMEKRR